MKFFIMQSSPPSCLFIPLIFKYSPQDPSSRTPQPMLFPVGKRPSFTHIQNNGQNDCFCA